MTTPLCSHHGCFSRFSRDASKTSVIRSNDWTHVRNKKGYKDEVKDKEQEEISKFYKQARVWNDVPKVQHACPYQQVAPESKRPQKNRIHLKNQKTQKNQKNNKNTSKKTLHDMSPKAFKSLLNEILRNEGRILKEKSAPKINLKEIKKSLKRSAALLLAQKSLFKKLLEFRTGRLPQEVLKYNFKVLRHDILSLPLHTPIENLRSAIIKHISKIDKLRDKVGKLLISHHRFSNELQDWKQDPLIHSDDVNDDSYVQDQFGYDNSFDEDADWIPIVRTPPKCRHLSFGRRKLAHQHCSLHKSWQIHECNKFDTQEQELEKKLQDHYTKACSFANEHERLTKKLSLVQVQGHFPDLVTSIQRELAKNISEDAWNKKELIRIHQQLNDIRCVWLLLPTQYWQISVRPKSIVQIVEIWKNR